jgi:RecA/RadA recombinase
MSAKTFTFDDLNKELSKISTYGDTLDKSEVSQVDHYISTGNYALNAALTGSVFGGFPNNRSVALAGPSGTGKTYLILNAVREAQKLGYYIVYYDSENAVDKSLVEKFGVDPSKLRYEPCNTVQEFRSSVTNLTKTLLDAKKKGAELPKVLIVLDSAGNLATQKEIDDAASGSDKSDMTRARLLKSTFRILMTQMGLCKIPFLFTNHVYQTQDLFSKTVAGGGTGPEYSASIILFLQKAKLAEGTSSGIIVTAKPNKNRFAKPTPVKFWIDFNKGMNPYVGLQDFISWDNCGIQRGRLIGEKDYGKLSEKDKEPCRKHVYKNDKGEDVTVYFQPSETARKLVVRHLNDTVDLNMLFKPEVITKEVLEELDEKIIKPTFSYGVEEDFGEEPETILATDQIAEELSEENE